MKKRYISKLDRIYSLTLFLIGLSVFIWGTYGDISHFSGAIFMFLGLTHFLSTIKEEILVELNELEEKKK